MKEDKVISLINDTTKLNPFFDFKKIKSILSRIEDIINSCNTCELTMLYAKLIFTSSKVESNHVIKFIKDIDSKLKSALINISPSSLDELNTYVDGYLNSTKYPNEVREINSIYQTFKKIKEELNNAKIYIKIQDLDKFKFNELIDFSLKYTMNIDSSMEARIISSIVNRKITDDDINLIDTLIKKYENKIKKLESEYEYNNLEVTLLDIKLDSSYKKEVLVRRVILLKTIKDNIQIKNNK